MNEVERWTWTVRAACRSAPDPEVFFGDAPQRQGNSLMEEEHRQAAAVTRATSFCRRCEVRSECLHHAITWPEHWGIWGGTTAAERGPIRAMMKLQNMSLPDAYARTRSGRPA
jgi:WhiB family transcriptional regulator, redox-sensing transcriptional regulator